VRWKKKGEKKGKERHPRRDDQKEKKKPNPTRSPPSFITSALKKRAAELRTRSQHQGEGEKKKREKPQQVLRWKRKGEVKERKGNSAYHVPTKKVPDRPTRHQKK